MAKNWQFIEKNYSPTLQRRIKWRLLKVHGGCEVCGESEWSKLVVHHKKYRVNVEPEHVSLLCAYHHNDLHRFCKGSDRELPRFTDDYIRLMSAEYRQAVAL